MRYIFVMWRGKNQTYRIAHDFGDDTYDVKDAAYWLRRQMDDVEATTYAFEEITKEQYDYYFKRKLTTENFG